MRGAIIHPQQSSVANHTNTRSYSQYNVYTCVFCRRVDLAAGSLIAGFAPAGIRPIVIVETRSVMLTKGTIAFYDICGKVDVHHSNSRLQRCLKCYKVTLRRTSSMLDIF